MAGTVTITTNDPIRDNNQRIIGKRLVINATADASDGSFPNTSLKKLGPGFLQPVITNPGSTAPTDNYDIKILHPSDSTADAAGSTLIDRDTTNTEIAATTISGMAAPVFIGSGTYTLAITGNSVNSATIAIVMEILFVQAP
jgi:hypothetical protein